MSDECNNIGMGYMSFYIHNHDYSELRIYLTTLSD